jgi:hypothetical protein
MHAVAPDAVVVAEILRNIHTDDATTTVLVMRFSLFARAVTSFGTCALLVFPLPFFSSEPVTSV